MSHHSIPVVVEPRSVGDSPLVASWRDVPTIAVPLGGEPLDLAQTLDCGQAFRWRRTSDSGSEDPEVWEGVVAGHVWRVRQVDGALFVQVFPELDESETTAFIRRYFWLDLAAAEVQRAVAAAHPLAAQAIEQFAGLRVLRQDATEVFLTFAIASATNVPRVTRSVALMSERYGEVIAVIDGVPHRAFPTPDALVAAPTEDLFGPCNLAFRARHIQSFARSLLVLETPTTLERLATGSYAEAHAALDALRFCGPKVADCICLFGLGFAEAVPVDVHVWAIAHELFGAAIPTRTLTPSTYQRIGTLFRDLFGKHAGWAQQHLFVARRATPIRDRSRPASG